MKKGDLVRIVNRVPLPHLVEEDIGKVGIVTHDEKGSWAIVLVEGKFQLQAAQNLDILHAEG